MSALRAYTDIEDQVRESVAAVLDVPADVYVRRRDLRQLFRIVPDEWLVWEGYPQIDTAVIEALSAELRREQDRSIAADLTYSASRRGLLFRALRHEVEMFDFRHCTRFDRPEV